MIILKSISIICIVSTICAAIAQPVYGIDFHKTFTAATAIQFVIGFVVSVIRDTLSTTKLKQLQVREIESYEKQGMDLKCAHCTSISYVPIRLDEHNTFTCPACNSSNAVYVDVTVARETTMMGKQSNQSIRSSSVNDDSITIKNLKSE